MEMAVQTKGLTKKYGTFTAVDSLDLESDRERSLAFWVRTERERPLRS
jgi:ABC-type multidrug transport system ATPase subunit